MRIRLLVFACLVLTGLARAETDTPRPLLDVARPFTDHMVLQRDLPVPVWGTASPGELITVRFAKQTRTATADASGRWQLELKPLKVSAEGRSLKINGSRTPLTIELTDVLVGEVWLCSGQSNMDFTVAKTEKYYFAGVNNEAAEVAAANYPLIRMFTGEWKRSYQPETTITGEWKVCTPQSVREFSAVGYFFARDLQRELKVPVGIVTLTYGASTAQAWIRREAIAADPRLKPALEEFDAKVQAYVPPTEDELIEWSSAVEKAKEAGQRPPRKPKPDPAQDQHNPTVMFNGMIAPVVPYAVRGVLWYQGESITGDRALFPLWNETLIRDWRTLWGRDSTAKGAEPLPFYFVQLAALNNASNSPEVRELQAAALRLPHTGMVVTIDIGDEKNVHPKNKQDVGYRLARLALADTYGRKTEGSGPQLESVAAANGALRLKFSHLGGGLVARGGPLQTFEVAGADGKFIPADAAIEGDTIVVRCAAITAPTAVRYAWAGYPVGCNLYNAAGLPAAPFRATVR
jgi:sialate O-acetylesterase